MPKRRRKAAKRDGADPQADAVYAWEEEWADWNRETITLAETRAHVREACRIHGLKPPPVRQHPGSAMSFSLDDGTLISFNTKHKNPAIALHEAAHYICDRLHPQAQPHGPRWLGIYMDLLVTAGVAPKSALYASARAHKLRWHK